MAGSRNITAAVGGRRPSQAETGRVRPRRLVRIPGFGPNPGELHMLAYAPQGLPPARPLVVVLHGCTQTAEGYAEGAGWMELADRHGFALVCPQQTAANNPNRCFNWFEPGDTGRGLGEAGSIHSMIEEGRRRFGSAPKNVYITGLSAGGAMASVMLACYPEVFAGGGIIAGLPYGVARGMPQAFAAMVQAKAAPAGALGALVRSASFHSGPWPRISVWHGAADKTVKPANADAIVRQWLEVWGPQADLQTVDYGRGRKAWMQRGEAVIEQRLIAGLAHGAPLDSTGPEGVGHPGPFLLEAGISSSRELLTFWGLAPARLQAGGKPATAPPPVKTTEREDAAAKPAAGNADYGIGAAIHKALKAAGLVK